MIWRVQLVLTALLTLLVLGPPPLAGAQGRLEVTHRSTGHEVHVSSPALAVTGDGGPLLTWAAHDGHANHLFLARPGAGPGAPVQVNPADLGVDSLHQGPGLAVGPGGEIYVSWSSRKARPASALFASDLRLSRSLDGGRSFETPLRVNEDRPMSHSFEGLAVAPDGTVLVSWIDSREGENRAATYLARVGERGSRVEQAMRLDGDTCVCCRVDLAAGPRGVAILWRKVFPGSIRDMVIGLSADGGRSLASVSRVSVDGWKLNACPHRGGRVALDGRGRIYAAWYTEGADGRPRVLFAVSENGRRFGPSRRLDTSAGTIPDQVQLAVSASGRVVATWQDATAVRRRILVRRSPDGGRTWGGVEVLSRAIKAYAPGVAVTRAGDFLVAWHEEQFPVTKTVVEPLHWPPVSSLGTGR
ncbi:MAG: glycoside hydrolase [Candidatus Rokubacteria bacterium]|nr:glycoside hydrolase [Candidatus Rokubacteria bacterium]